VFELFANPLRMKDWYPEVDSVEIVSQQPLRYRMTAGGITGEMETTVLAPNEHIVTKSLPNAMGMSCEWDTRLSPTATGTRIVHTAHMKFSSPFLRFLMSLMDANKEELKTLESMKRYAESH